MKHLLLTTIAAVVLVGWGESQPTAKAPDISIHKAVESGNLTALKQHLKTGTNIESVSDEDSATPFANCCLVWAYGNSSISN